jgi:hypothetical protein
LISAAEFAEVYHGCEHSLIYVSTDCNVKLNCKIFEDSYTAAKIRCRRTKAERLVENLLRPRSVEMVLEQMGVNGDSQLFYSISSDASNKGARKMFPLVVKFFDKDNGTQNKLVDFYEDDYEDLLAIFNAISKSLDELKLSRDMITAYSTDNASVNYG